jgi:hypothetical protein
MNITSSQTPVGWHSEPSTDRGTFSLLRSCILTIWICSWSAIHLNVPADSESYWTILVRKIRWMAVTIMAPELITAYSCHDLTEAWALVKKLNEISKSSGRGVSFHG